MKFCKTCGNILVIKNSEFGRSLFCKKCNETTPLTDEIIIKYQQQNQEQVIVFGEGEDKEFPVTQVLCPKCDKHVDAYWALQQTRAADEPPTRFYRCKVCNYVWREYS